MFPLKNFARKGLKSCISNVHGPMVDYAQLHGFKTRTLISDNYLVPARASGIICMGCLLDKISLAEHKTIWHFHMHCEEYFHYLGVISIKIYLNALNGILFW